MTKTQTPDPHDVAKRLIGDPLRFVREGVQDVLYSAAVMDELKEAVRAQGDSEDYLSEDEREALHQKIKDALPEPLQSDLDRLMAAELENEALTHEAAFLIGLYAGRGCSCR